jgi:hypothetical protein
MKFKQFKEVFLEHVETMLKDQQVLFTVDVDKDKLWELYLDSFPPGTNEIYKEKREFDCSCCRHFVKEFGNVVTIHNNQLMSIWDFGVVSTTYQPVVAALSTFVKAHPVNNVFITKVSQIGTSSNNVLQEDGSVHTWSHFAVELPSRFVSQSSETLGTQKSQLRDTRNVFKRSLEEISKESLETVLDLTAQKSLYKGDEWSNVLTKFLFLQNEYQQLTEKEQELYCWEKSVEIGGAIGRIRNHSIGVLLLDITAEVDLNDAVKKYERIVAPSNYKRPKAIFSKRMLEKAEQTLTELGLLESLNRRFATLSDITVNNVLFANKDTARRISGNVFSELQSEVKVNPKQFDHVEEIHIEHFVEHILPRTSKIDIYLENRHVGNLVSIIAPQNIESKTMFKWDNGFSWAYSGNIADSMKQRVKAAGGNINGVLRFSIQWNENNDNPNDFDAHCVEPDGNHIWFRNAGRKHSSTGMLDVDIIDPGKRVAVENIVWTSKERMQEGEYNFYVHNYSHRGGRAGFQAEIEYDNQIYSYEYNKELAHDEEVSVVRFNFSKTKGIEFLTSLPVSTSTQSLWGLHTNQFHSVPICMFSSNYWNEQEGIGNKHHIFILNGCKNEERPNGFFNEFLREEFMPHKHVFEALGSKMRVSSSDDQLSGLGFSSTKRNSVICKLEGHVTRIVKLLF